MSATEPPQMTTSERVRGTFECDPDAEPPCEDGSWRTLVQKKENGVWVTKNQYPGDWALQWEAVAADERARVARFRTALQKARECFGNLY